MSAAEHLQAQTGNEIIARLAAAEGISYWGVAPAEPATENSTADHRQAAIDYRQWISDGRHGEMGFLRTHEPMKYRPGGIVEGAASVIVFALGYYRGRGRVDAIRVANLDASADTPAAVSPQAGADAANDGPGDASPQAGADAAAARGENGVGTAGRDRTESRGHSPAGAEVVQAGHRAAGPDVGKVRSKDGPADASQGENDPGASIPAGQIALYARGRDYHKEFGSRLKRIAAELTRQFPGHSFRAFTDTSPLQERWYAEQAGVVFTGRNTLSLHRELGSYFFLGEIISTMEFVPTERRDEAKSHCPGSCRRCIDVCPTGALESPHRIDGSKCISYLTIEHKGIISDELMAKMGTWVFGCDLCQEVCPFNIRAAVTDVENFLKPVAAGEQDLAELLNMKAHEDMVARFAGTAVMRAGRVGMVRNALIAAANGGSRELLPRIRELVRDENEVISYTARWALKRLEEA